MGRDSTSMLSGPFASDLSLPIFAIFVKLPMYLTSLRLRSSSTGAIFWRHSRASFQLRASSSSPQRPKNFSAGDALHESTISRSAASQLAASSSYVSSSSSSPSPISSSPRGDRLLLFFPTSSSPSFSPSESVLLPASSCILFSSPESIRSSVS